MAQASTNKDGVAIFPIKPNQDTIVVTRGGDLAAVGCLVDSDRTCPHCRAGLEQFCPNMILTYNAPDKHLGGVT